MDNFKATFSTPEERDEILATLPQFEEGYDRLIEDYNKQIKRGYDDKDTMIEMRTRFNNCRRVSSKIKTALVYYKSKYDDRACSAKRARITGQFIRNERDVTVKKSDAEKWAAADTQEYQDFLEMKNETAEAFSNILNIREDLQNYINDITGRINSSRFETKNT